MLQELPAKDMQLPTFFFTVSFNYYFAWILSCLVLYETHTTYKHLLIMLIYTLQHLVNVLLKRLLHSVLWQPTTLCFVFFLFVVHVKCHPHAEAGALPHSAHVLRPHCCVYVQFISTLPPSARTAGSTSVTFSRGLLFRGAHYCTGQNMQPEQRQVNKFLKHFSSTAQVPRAALGQICHGRNRV